MKQFFCGVALCVLPFSTVAAKPLAHSSPISTDQTGYSKKSVPGNIRHFVQKNLIGEVSSIDAVGGKFVVQAEDKTSATVIYNDKTSFRRVQPGQTSLANAEQIKFSDVKVGDRVLIPGGLTDALTPVRQIIVMARAAIDAQRNDDLERRRARTTVGRITSVNTEKKEITVQARGRGNVETVTVSTSANVKIQRYAPDSLKASDAVAATLSDLRVGDQIRVLGDRSPDGGRITAEEILSGSVKRTVGTVSEINAARNEIVIKNAQGQLTTVTITKNSTLRRITPEVAANLKERFQRRAERRSESGSQNANRDQTPQERQRRREERRNQNADQQRTNQNRRQMFDDLPAISIADLKKGDAVLITGTNPGADSSRLTAVSIISGDGDLQQILQRTQGGRNGGSNMSPGLPGNVSGGNDLRDDEPKD